MDDARFAGDRHDLHEQRLERRQVLLPELRDRAVGRKIARRQHAIGYIVFQFPRDPTRRKRPRGIGVQQHRHHHLRVERLIAPPIPFVGRIECLEIQRGDGVGDEERQVPIGEPVTRRGREQQRLIRRTGPKGRRHTCLYVPSAPSVSAAQLARTILDPPALTGSLRESCDDGIAEPDQHFVGLDFRGVGFNHQRCRPMGEFDVHVFRHGESINPPGRLLPGGLFQTETVPLQLSHRRNVPPMATILAAAYCVPERSDKTPHFGGTCKDRRHG